MKSPVNHRHNFDKMQMRLRLEFAMELEITLQ